MYIWNACFSPLHGGDVTVRTDEIRFDVQNEPLTPCEYAIESEGDFRCGEYLVMEYAADSLMRDVALHAPLLLGKSGEEYIPLCEVNDIHIDASPHRVVVPLKEKVFSHLKIRFLTKAARASFRLFRLYSCDADELPLRFSECAAAAEPGFLPLCLDSLYNAAMPETPGVMDGGRGLPEGEAALSGIPFRFGAAPFNRIAPPPPPAENEEMILNFGVPAQRGLCRPVSRDSEIAVSVHETAREILFAAAITGNLYERCGFCAPDPTVLGTETGEVMMPLSARDVERFQVEIIYENGLCDTAFPYHLSLRRHVMTGETGLYAVPAGPWMIEKIVFRNRIPDADVSILAVTLNLSHAPLIPAAPALPPPGPAQDYGPDGILRKEHLFILTSGKMQLHLRAEKGLFIDRLLNGYAPDSHARGPLLSLRLADGSLVHDFDTRVLACDGRELRVLLKRGSLACTVSLAVHENDTLRLSLSAVNEGTEALSCGIIFPALNDVSFADREDSWYLFPKYQNTLGNGRICVYEESAPSFPMQFFDLFSPSQNGGLGVLTMERELTVRKYALTKDESICAYVEYPAMYMRLAPGETFTASPTDLFVHPGNWQAAFRRYKEWLSTWYRPHKSQNKDWYRRCFWLMAEITDFYETESFTRLPSWYNAQTGEYYFSSIMEEQKSLYGSYPDILHLWGWTFDEKTHHQMWGHFGDTDYERIGGLHNFVAALNDCSEKTGAAVSLYIHPTLLTDSYPEAKQYMPELMTRCEDLSPIGVYDDSFRMCHANDRWKEHVLEMYRRIQRETHVPIMYVDEFSLRTGNRCFAPNHGHAVPSNLLKTDREFISALRDAVDEEIVLYGEYAAVDVNARYIDCNITYHILDSIRDMIENAWTADDSDDSLDRVFLDLYRFAFPGIVQLVLPMAMRHLSWQPLKSTFFNGEAIYDSFWDAEESRGREFMGKAFRIKKQYGDCFASDCPETMIASPLPGVCMNRFPGKGRTLYTLMSRAWETRRGTLLELNDIPGAEYWDVWNDRPITVERKDGVVRIPGEIGAQEVGCILVTYPDEA